MKGFTIIEIIVAVFILVIGIVAVLNMFPLGIQVAKLSQMASLATQLGQTKMEEMLSKPYDDSALAVGTTTEDYGSIVDFASHKRETEISCVRRLDLSEVACDYDAFNDPHPLKKIDITVSWKSSFGGIERSINLVTLLAKK